MRRMFYVGVVMLVGLLSSLAAVAGAAEPGITDSEVVLGVWTSLTGPTAEVGSSTRDALQIWSTQLNAAGGVHGRKVRLVVYDDAG